MLEDGAGVVDDGLEVESEDGDDEEEDVEVADEEFDALESELVESVEDGVVLVLLPAHQKARISLKQSHASLLLVLTMYYWSPADST